jgi:hypothetical protein
MRLQKLLLRFQCNRRSRFRSFNETAEADLAVSLRPRKRLPRFQWDCGIWFGGFIETAEVASMVSMRPRKQLWRIQLDCGILIKTYIIFPRKGSFQHKTMFKTVWLWRDCRSGFSGINETVEADSAVSMRQRKRLLLSQWDCGILCDTAEALAKMNIGFQFL